MAVRQQSLSPTDSIESVKFRRGSLALEISGRLTAGGGGGGGCDGGGGVCSRQPGFLCTSMQVKRTWLDICTYATDLQPSTCSVGLLSKWPPVDIPPLLSRPHGGRGHGIIYSTHTVSAVTKNIIKKQQHLNAPLPRYGYLLQEVLTGV